MGHFQRKSLKILMLTYASVSSNAFWADISRPTLACIQSFKKHLFCSLARSTYLIQIHKKYHAVSMITASLIFVDFSGSVLPVCSSTSFEFSAFIALCGSSVSQGSWPGLGWIKKSSWSCKKNNKWLNIWWWNYVHWSTLHEEGRLWMARWLWWPEVCSCRICSCFSFCWSHS